MRQRPSEILIKCFIWQEGGRLFFSCKCSQRNMNYVFKYPSDEADVFLEARTSGSNPNRNALVSGRA